jgi:uncharacterized protein
MGLPRKLKNFILHVNGAPYGGEVPELSLPKLARKMDGYRAGGMGGEVKIDMGQEPIELEYTAGGMVSDLLANYGAVTHDALLARFTGAYQREDTGQIDSIEVIVRGRDEEIDFGSQKPGDGTETKHKVTCSYYKLSRNGVAVIEIDLINNILIVNGVDRMAEIRDALGTSGINGSINLGNLSLGF